MKTQIRRLIGQDPDSRAYYSRTELTKKIAFGIRGGSPQRDAEILAGRGGAEVADIPEMPESPVLDAVIEIPGVVAAEVHPYHVTVRRSPMFEWDEIEPFILRLLTAFNVAGGEGRLEEADVRQPPEAL